MPKTPGTKAWMRPRESGSLLSVTLPRYLPKNRPSLRRAGSFRVSITFLTPPPVRPLIGARNARHLGDLRPGSGAGQHELLKIAPLSLVKGQVVAHLLDVVPAVEPLADTAQVDDPRGGQDRAVLDGVHLPLDHQHLLDRAVGLPLAEALRVGRRQPLVHQERAADRQRGELRGAAGRPPGPAGA